jgi:hypothetical protein
MEIVGAGELTMWDLWPIGSAALVACIFVFLGVELLAHWMRSGEEKEENPPAWSDVFSKRSAYGLTVLIVLFVLVCGVIAVGLLMGRR